MTSLTPIWRPRENQEALAEEKRIPVFQPVPPETPPKAEIGSTPQLHASMLARHREDPDFEKDPGHEPEAIKHNHHLPEADIKSGNAAAYPKFKKIFSKILRETARLLDEINAGVLAFNRGEGSARYTKAKMAFEEFLNDLDNPHSHDDEHHRASRFNGVTIKWVSIAPKHEGALITGATVIVKWMGGTHHSSSSLP